MSGNRVKDISFINKLPNLKELYLENNQIQNFTDVQKNDNLKILSLYKNEITDITDITTNFKNLERLELSYNKLLKSIEGIDNLKKLKVLHLKETDFEGRSYETK